MSGVFDESYASAYDEMYADKDDSGECNAVMRLVEKFAEGKIKRVLDLGCGTGRHAIPLAARGLDITGVDFSEAMLKRARARPRPAGGSLEFLQGDVRAFTGNGPYDAVLMNFNVLGYMNTNDDLRGAFATARRNLRPGGVFVADFWHGPAVMADPPGDRLREVNTSQGRFLRFSSGVNQPERQRMEITIKVIQTKDAAILSETQEVHGMRYFFPLELELALHAQGLKLAALTGFPNVDQPVSDKRWLAALTAVAQ